jgi:hypothetical protein
MLENERVKLYIWLDPIDPYIILLIDGLTFLAALGEDNEINFIFQLFNQCGEISRSTACIWRVESNGY